MTQESTANSAKLPVLVTGATGFLGFHICEALKSEGYEVHALSRKPSENNSQFHHVCDLTSPNGLDKILASQEWYGIIHLAGLISYVPSDAKAMEAINVHATRYLLEEVMRTCPKAKFLFCSSVVAVGSNTQEDDPLVDEDRAWDSSMDHIAYARTKRIAEDLVLAAGASKHIRAAALCPSNIFGPRDGLKGSRKSQIRAANGRMRVYPHGGVSIVHVKVVVEAFLRLLKTPSDDDIWNGSRWLITGDNITVREMLSLCADAGGNAKYAPWLTLPNWVLALMCWIGQRMGSSSLTMDRYELASRYNWFDGSRARKRFGLSMISARKAITDSVVWMREKGLVQPRT